jgi:AraC family transcriptional regulator
MTGRRIYRAEETHDVLRRFRAEIAATSDGLGWSSTFASMQREQPFEATFRGVSDCLMVLHRSGPVDVTFTSDGRAVTRRVPRGGIFFLPAGQACEVALQARLDTTHIYLRAELFAGEDGGAAAQPGELAPLFGERDTILEHLALAIGEAVSHGQPCSSLLVDPIARAMASRFVAIDRGSSPDPAQSRPLGQLSTRQQRRIRDFVEGNLDTDIRLSAMAAACGLSTEYFVKAFKNSVGVSPYQYVIGLRVERARALLDDDSLSLSEIALQCGFSHQEHMTRMFRRVIGEPPGRYRRNCH